MEKGGITPASNRLTGIATPATSRVLSRDAAGNLTDDGAGQTFSYNQAGRLASAETTTGATRYRYNALGLRTHKEGMTSVVFHYDAGGRLLAETTPEGTPIRSYVWFGDEPLAQLDGSLDAETPTYLHTDHLATPRLGTDQAGIPVWRWESPAFGEAPPSLQLRTVNLRFPGQYFDSETGLHQNWHRYYDPKTGRYLASDPIGLAGGGNTYAYVEGNPISYTDPNGLYCVYSQSTGSTVCYAVSVESPPDAGTEAAPEYYSETGYSGTGSGRNNPDAQNQTNVGPIPRGPWQTGVPYNSANTGRNTIPLTPLPGNECGPPRDCSSFRAHGNNARNDASQGCIVLPPNRTTIPPGEVIFVTR